MYIIKETHTFEDGTKDLPRYFCKATNDGNFGFVYSIKNAKRFDTEKGANTVLNMLYADKNDYYEVVRI